jgi:hypothetical protein
MNRIFTCSKYIRPLFCGVVDKSKDLYILCTIYTIGQLYLNSCGLCTEMKYPQFFLTRGSSVD